MKESKRRDFLKKGGLALATTAVGIGTLASCHSNSEKKEADYAVHTTKKYRWTMVTTWPPKFPVMGEGLEMMAEWIKVASNDRMNIKVMGAGELIPALECFDAVGKGGAHMASSVAYYWAGKLPATQFFAAVPFGMNAQQMNAWIINGGGLKLWEELYAPHNLIPVPGGNTGVQMGGWFRKPINSMQDLKGLKMRMPGLGGKVLAKAGGTAVLAPGTELYTSLERGNIDATEWIGPYHDYKMGFYNVAKYYYYPGWHEPGPILEIMLNKEKFEALPRDLQEIIRMAVYRLNGWILGEFEARNNLYLKKLVEEEGVRLKKYPTSVLKQLKVYAQEAIQELAATDAMSKKVYASYARFKKDISAWANVSEKIFYDDL